MTPLKILLRLMTNRRAPLWLRFMAARSVAPYMIAAAEKKAQFK